MATPSASARRVNSRRVIDPERSASCSAANGPVGFPSLIAGSLLSENPTPSALWPGALVDAAALPLSGVHCKRGDRVMGCWGDRESRSRAEELLVVLPTTL